MMETRVAYRWLSRGVFALTLMTCGAAHGGDMPKQYGFLICEKDNGPYKISGPYLSLDAAQASSDFINSRSSPVYATTPVGWNDRVLSPWLSANEPSKDKR